MGPKEVLWRVKAQLRDRTDRLLVSRRQRPRPLGALVLPGRDAESPGFRVTSVPLGEGSREDLPEPVRRWRDELLDRADRVAAGRVSFFDLVDVPLGSPIDWQLDRSANRSAPRVYQGDLDYRDFDQVGDCKLVWEPNRHHHLVVLGRAYRLSGDPKYARAVLEQWESWVAANPYGIGMNWRSPLELAVRLINWVWAFDLIRESGLVDRARRERLLDVVHRQAWEVRRKYSRGSSANNHTIGEAAGVFVAAAYFDQLADAQAWREEARDILCREMQRQTHADGGNCEQALSYHVFVLQFFTLACLVGRKAGCRFPEAYERGLEKMFEFAAAMVEAVPKPSMYGDCDDGIVLDLGAGPRDIRPWVRVGAALLPGGGWAEIAREPSEPAWWLTGDLPAEGEPEIPQPVKKRSLTSRAFAETGYYLLQHGERDSGRGIRVLFDCGPLGYGSIAAHGHADALSLTLAVGPTEILVDPGTYDYFTFPEWRAYFRSTRAHNTVVVDGEDQSVMLGPFLWGERAHAECLRWAPDPTGGEVSGQHDGYCRFQDAVRHVRSVTLDGPSGTVAVRDELRAEKRHRYAQYWHLGESCRLVSRQGTLLTIEWDTGRAILMLDERLSVELLRGHDAPIGGWVSRAYHQKAPTTTVVASCQTRGRLTLATTIRLERP